MVSSCPQPWKYPHLDLPGKCPPELSPRPFKTKTPQDAVAAKAAIPSTLMDSALREVKETLQPYKNIPTL